MSGKPANAAHGTGTVHAWLRSNVLGLIAIFVALGGTAFAVQKAPKNSVVSSSIKNGQVKQKDLGDAAVDTENLAAGAVNSSRVADDSLTGGDIDEASLSGVKAAPTGSAGGELSGAYPNPTIGTVSGLDLAPHSTPAGGVHFGNDGVAIYRTALLGAGGLGTQNYVALESAGSEMLLSPNAILAFDSKGTPGRGFIIMDEATGIPAAPANNAILAVRDSGGGTTQLIAVFPGGDIDVIAADPNP